MEQNEILNAANAHVDGAALLEVGTWIGRHQAFGLIASKCSAADAACLREIRDNKHYRALGLTWEEFCSRHTGIDSRRRNSSSKKIRVSLLRPDNGQPETAI